MRAVLQRCTTARVVVDEQVIGELSGPGLVVLLGVTHDDSHSDAEALARKIANLRIMREERSLLDSGGGALVISQFTLYADTRKGRRPSWGQAAPGTVAEPLYEQFCVALETAGVWVARGKFGAEMAVDLVNDGPVTLFLES